MKALFPLSEGLYTKDVGLKPLLSSPAPERKEKRLSGRKEKLKFLFFTLQLRYRSLLQQRRGCEDVLAVCFSSEHRQQEGNS